MAALVGYAACQSVCSGGWVACYSAAGLVAGTVTAGVGAPVAALACNAACGACMKVCAWKFLAEGAAETAATGGVIGPVNIVGGAVVAASGWFGRGALARAAASVAGRLGAGTAAGSGTGAAAASGGTAAASGGAAAASGGAAVAWLPVTLAAITVIGLGVGAYQGYQWWKTPQFPTGIQVVILSGQHANATGHVVGIAAGNVVVDLGNGSPLLSMSPQNLVLSPSPVGQPDTQATNPVPPVGQPATQATNAVPRIGQPATQATNVVPPVGQPAVEATDAVPSII